MPHILANRAVLRCRIRLPVEGAKARKPENWKHQCCRSVNEEQRIQDMYYAKTNEWGWSFSFPFNETICEKSMKARFSLFSYSNQSKNLGTLVNLLK